ERALMRYKEAILEAEYAQDRISDAAIALYTASCTLARLDRDLTTGSATELDRTSGELYLRMANRRFDQALRDLDDNDDPQTTRAADAALAGL
ncbi:MAG: acyl-CoA dehydrogenase, partial [Isosphaeraceae bacterium]